MPDTLQIFHHSPPSHPHLNIDSQFNCLIDTDFPAPGIFDGSDHFASPEFAGSPFSNFSTSSFDELSAVSNVTASIGQNQSVTKRKFRIDDVVEEDCRKRRAVGDTGSIKPHVKMSSCTDNCNENSKPKMDPKPDYIQVRARRGEATDNHSLAERARREKIKKKMKFLQDIVPGCDKITNKAAMLDEIINYVQCLQRQVEFLTMKLAASTSNLDFQMENLLLKEFPAYIANFSTAADLFPVVLNSAHQHHGSPWLGGAASTCGIETPIDFTGLAPPVVNLHSSGFPKVQGYELEAQISEACTK